MQRRSQWDGRINLGTIKTNTLFSSLAFACLPPAQVARQPAVEVMKQTSLPLVDEEVAATLRGSGELIRQNEWWGLEGLTQLPTEPKAKAEEVDPRGTVAADESFMIFNFKPWNTSS